MLVPAIANPFFSYLDLSFNEIRRIENLETLINLRELYLVSNKVTQIENLGSLTALTTLELGCNRLRVRMMFLLLDATSIIAY